MKYLVLLSLLLCGCGKSETPNSGTALITAAAASETCPLSVAPALTDEFIIACPEIMTAKPEILKRFATSILRVGGSGTALTYTLLSAGYHTSNDGRGCVYLVTTDGQVQ